MAIIKKSVKKQMLERVGERGSLLHYLYAKSLQSCLTLCEPADCNSPGSSVRGILQARILEWAAMPPPPEDLPNPGTEPSSLTCPALASRFFAICTTSATWEAPLHYWW